MLTFTSALSWWGGTAATGDGQPRPTQPCTTFRPGQGRTCGCRCGSPVSGGDSQGWGVGMWDKLEEPESLGHGP